jgi:hypothetical protein
MNFYHVLAIVAVVAIVILLINRHYQKKGVPLEYAHEEEESMQHRIIGANTGMDDDPFFKDSPY